MPKLALSIPQPVADARPLVVASPAQSEPRILSRRRLLASAGVAATLGTAALSVAGTAPAPADDAGLFDLCRRWREMQPVIDRLNEEHSELSRLLPSWQWTPEELTAHRIDGKKDEPRYLSLRDIEKNDGWDSPRAPKTQHTTTDDGTTWVMTVTSVRPTATEEDLTAWRDRCAARRALYDAKEAAHDEAYRTCGVEACEERLDAAYDEQQRLADEIKAHRPNTLAGVLEKMRVFRESDGESFDGDPDELNWSATLFLAALADLERIATQRREVLHA